MRTWCEKQTVVKTSEMWCFEMEDFQNVALCGYTQNQTNRIRWKWGVRGRSPSSWPTFLASGHLAEPCVIETRCQRLTLQLRHSERCGGEKHCDRVWSSCLYWNTAATYRCWSLCVSRGSSFFFFYLWWSCFVIFVNTERLLFRKNELIN